MISRLVSRRFSGDSLDACRDFSSIQGSLSPFQGLEEVFKKVSLVSHTAGYQYTTQHQVMSSCSGYFFYPDLANKTIKCEAASTHSVCLVVKLNLVAFYATDCFHSYVGSQMKYSIGICSTLRVLVFVLVS